MNNLLSWFSTIAALGGGYLLGSIPFGLILTHAAGLGDIRQIGSGNIGATNVLRTGKKALAVATLMLDALKGAVAAMISLWLWGQGESLLAAVAAMIGHTYPVWLGFRGGKGVATALGVLLAVTPIVGALACAIWLVTAWLSRISSLSALVALGITPVTAWLFEGAEESLLATIIAVVVFLRHKTNIERLIAGQEPRIGQKKENTTE
ncbi:Glycerol-3-phosphate acyltransferase [Azospirillaceae bacterium]